MAHADVRVPRIDAASPEFRMLILAVRQCILRCVLAKSASGEPEPPSKRQRVDQPDTKQPRPRAAPPLKFVLDARKIGMWISKLTMFNILPTLTAEDALFFLAAQQTRILDFVNDFLFRLPVLNPFSSFCTFSLPKEELSHLKNRWPDYASTASTAKPVQTRDGAWCRTYCPPTFS